MENNPRTRTVGPRAMAALLALVLLPITTGASTRSKNFVVEAPTPEMARQIAEYAEHYRELISKQWLGEPLPEWSRPCAIRIKLTRGEAGGVTSFGFGRGTVLDQEISLEGRFERILASALPHEITHTIFASYFGGPLPRWADEGASLLSEDRRERMRHEQFAADLMTRGGGWPLGELFTIDEYPDDLMGFYGQGYSVSRFLIETWGRPRFLAFLKDGMKDDWNTSTRTHYGFPNSGELDRAWRSWHAIASRTVPSEPSPGDGIVLRAQSPEDHGHRHLGR